MILTKNTADLRRLVTEHVAADQVVQGQYWENNKGCFIGCLNHSNDPQGAETEFGLPIMVQRIAESIFDDLPAEEAKAFFASLPNAVHSDGMDLSRVGWQFLAAELRAMPEQPDEIQVVIDPVIAGIDLLPARHEWPEAIKAAKAAANVAWVSAWTADAAAKAADAAASAAYAADAAPSAAYAANAAPSAAYAANAAADAAPSAAYAANAAPSAAYAANAAPSAAYAANAAGSAAYAADDPLDCRRRQRDLLLKLINESPIVSEDNQQ